MITTGIIKEVNTSSNGYTSNTCMVELPIFNSASDALNYTTIVEATVCLSGGIYDCYSVGDFVYVGFVDNKYNFPVILGKIYKGLDDKFSGSYQIQNIKVANQSILSEHTQIGDIKYKDLLRSVVTADNQININNFNTKSTLVDTSDGNLYISDSVNIGTWVDGSNLNRIVYTWEKNISANTAFSKTITLTNPSKDFWWDTTTSYIKEIGQPFYISADNNFNLSIDYENKNAVISGKVTKNITKIYATLLYTS